MTVSRVINGGARVVAETRERVEAAIASLNYVPDPAARSLAGTEPCRLALLYDNPSTSFLSELLVGSLSQARKSDAQLLIEPYDASETVDDLTGRLQQHRVDGVLLPALLCDDPQLVQGLQTRGFAIARIAATSLTGPGHAVGIDDEAAAHAMTRHLIALGHRRIGFIAGPQRHHVSELRLKGYLRALHETGLKADTNLQARGDFTYRSGLEASLYLLNHADRPTAIFASNDDMAAAAIAQAHRLHLNVPEDLSVCGFDDTALARTIWPELTTIRQPVAEMASQAVDLLVRQLRKDSTPSHRAPQQVRLAYEVVRRASDAAPHP